jgi:hypothetical protein
MAEAQADSIVFYWRLALGMLLVAAVDVRQGHGERYFSARRWLADDAPDYALSFRNCAETLGLDPARLKRQLLRRVGQSLGQVAMRRLLAAGLLEDAEGPVQFLLDNPLAR